MNADWWKIILLIRLTVYADARRVILAATPGPWRADDKPSWGHAGIRVMAGDVEVARVPIHTHCTHSFMGEKYFPAVVEFEEGGSVFTTEEEAARLPATARLVASAPQLLEALKEIMPTLARDFDAEVYARVAKKAHAAIATAEGSKP